MNDEDQKETPAGVRPAGAEERKVDNSAQILPPAAGDVQAAPSDKASRYDAVPETLRDQRQWLLFRLVPRQGKPGKFDKVPDYVDGSPRRGKQGSDEDRARLASFDEALAALKRGGYDGLGFAMLSEAQVIALDFDNCVDEAGTVAQWVLYLVAGTYTELSPSGRGVRAFFAGALPDFKNHVEGIEVFNEKGFVTVTGRVLKP